MIKKNQTNQKKKKHPHQTHGKEEDSAVGLGVAWPRGGGGSVGAALQEHLPPHHQLPHTLLCPQTQQAEVLTVQTHIQQVLFRQVVRYQITLSGKRTGLQYDCLLMFY